MGRQVRLREEYTDWYPSIPPETWRHAETIRRIVLRQLRHGSPSWTPGTRALSDIHFEFRGDSATGTPQAAGVERRRRVPRVTPRQAPTNELS
jgi:hypothetical protein